MEYVDATAVATRLAQVVALGLDVDDITRASGIDAQTIRALLTRAGERPGWVRADHHASLMGFALDLDALDDQARLPANESTQRIRSLAAKGWTYAALAARMGTTAATIEYLMASATIPVRRARQIRDLHAALAGKPGPAGGRQARTLPDLTDPDHCDRSRQPTLFELTPTHGTSTPAPERTIPEHVDWVAVDRAVHGEPRRLRGLERDAAVVQMAEAGISDELISERLQTSVRTVLRIREHYDVGPGRRSGAGGYRGHTTRHQNHQTARQVMTTTARQTPDPVAVARYCAGHDVDLTDVERASAIASYLAAGWDPIHIGHRMGLTPRAIDDILTSHGAPAAHSTVSTALRRIHLQEV